MYSVSLPLPCNQEALGTSHTNAAVEWPGESVRETKYIYGSVDQNRREMLCKKRFCCGGPALDHSPPKQTSKDSSISNAQCLALSRNAKPPH